jgi:hypothetical protein
MEVQTSLTLPMTLTEASSQGSLRTMGRKTNTKHNSSSLGDKRAFIPSLRDHESGTLPIAFMAH